MIVRAYWGPRAESRESATRHIVDYLESVSRCDSKSMLWYEKAYSRAKALRKGIDPEPNAVSRVLRQQRDMDRIVMKDLGYSFAAWNDGDMSFSVTIGCWNPRVRNVAVVTIGNRCQYSVKYFRCLVENVVRVFDPDHAIVTAAERMLQGGSAMAPANGMFVYVKGEELKYDPEVARSIGVVDEDVRFA